MIWLCLVFLILAGASAMLRGRCGAGRPASPTVREPESTETKPGASTAAGAMRPRVFLARKRSKRLSGLRLGGVPQGDLGRPWGFEVLTFAMMRADTARRRGDRSARRLH